MAMDERPAKLQKLEGLRRRVPHVSASSLASILAEIKQQGVPDLHGRNHVRQARNAKLESHSAYGPMLKEIQLVAKDGSKQPCIMVNFLTMTQALFELGGGYHDLLKATFNAKPCSRDMPYNLIFYSDEVVCGNPLSADTSKKGPGGLPKPQRVRCHPFI